MGDPIHGGIDIWARKKILLHGCENVAWLQSVPVHCNWPTAAATGKAIEGKKFIQGDKKNDENLLLTLIRDVLPSAWAEGSYRSGLLAARTVETKSTGGYHNSSVSPCTSNTIYCETVVI